MTSTAQTFTATVEGQVFTRTSKTMTYTHAIVVNGQVWAWSQSKTNAWKRTAEFAARGFTSTVIPVDGGNDVPVTRYPAQAAPAVEVAPVVEEAPVVEAPAAPKKLSAKDRRFAFIAEVTATDHGDDEAAWAKVAERMATEGPALGRTETWKAACSFASNPENIRIGGQRWAAISGGIRMGWAA